MASPSLKQAAVVARALVSSLGHDVVTSCAAARAGITRPSERHAYPVSSVDSPQGDGVTVHAVAWLTQGFEGEMRLVRLIEGALRDLMRQAPDAPWESATTGVFVSLPDPRRLLAGSALLGEEADRDELDERARSETSPAPRETAEHVLSRAQDLAGWATPLTLVGCADSGSTGTAEMVSQAIEALDGGRIELALILAADSFLDVETLTWLDDTARLKTPHRPAGFQPGEASGCLLLEAPGRARSRGARILGTLDVPSITREPDCLLEGRPPRGHALAKAIVGQSAHAGWAPGMRPWLISDQAGEVYQAMEWGNAWGHLAAQLPCCADLTTWTPAEFFGATGAASGLVAVCVALAAFDRGYSPSPSAVIINSGDGPPRTAMTVSAHLADRRPSFSR